MSETIAIEHEDRPLFKGRMPIYVNAESVDATNVLEVLDKAKMPFGVNSAQIAYLWRYYRGVQPILDRVKDVRPEINNKIVENRAQEIVIFKLGYQLDQPLQYTCRAYDSQADHSDAENPVLEDVNELNTLMFAEDKASADRDLMEWMCIGGCGFRMVTADTDEDREEGSAPFEIYTLDPRASFVAYSSSYRHQPLLGVWVGKGDDDVPVYNCFTDKEFFLVKGNEIVESRPHSYGRIPIIEYKLNNARMGVFEPVLPLLDAINAIESNRLDGIEQTVQALMKFVNCKITAEDFVEMLKLGAVQVVTTEGAIGQADVDYITCDLDQTATQVTKDDIYQAIVNICGMPNRNGTKGSSSDTGAAVLLRDGWTLAETHAKGYELQFKKAERDFLRVVLSICDQSKDCHINLRIRDIELAFNRRNYENALTKSQVLTTMLASPKIHPQLAFESCGMFTDPEAAYLQSREYMEEEHEVQEAKQTFVQHIGSQQDVPEPGEGAAQAALSE